jgi:DNA-directed RNA polymerase sigma subunit (sigma70/sigma32)
MKCLEEVKRKKICCQEKKCRQWIDYKDDLNCVLRAVEKDNKGMTLREVAKRIGVSFVRIKQIEDCALKKIQSNNPQLFEYLLKDDF